MVPLDEDVRNGFGGSGMVFAFGGASFVLLAAVF